MSWAEVFKINSDMTTPLNKLIIGQKRFAASDSPTLAVLLNSTVSMSSTEYNAGTFTPKISGTIRVAVDYVMASGQTMNLKVYRNDTLVLSKSRTETGVTASNGGSWSEDVNIYSGGTYKFTLSGTTSSSANRATSLKISAQLTDSNYFDYTTS